MGNKRHGKLLASPALPGEHLLTEPACSLLPPIKGCLPEHGDKSSEGQALQGQLLGWVEDAWQLTGSAQKAARRQLAWEQ